MLFRSDLWAKKDSGTFAGTQFVPLVKTHGAKLYRISGQNRSAETLVNVSTSSPQANFGDTVLLNISVMKTGNATATPTGSFVVLRNDTVVGVLPVDNAGNAVYTACNLAAGTSSYKVKYSGNSVYSPQTGNIITIEVKKNETFLENTKKNRFTLTSENHKITITGTQSGDELAVYNSSGQLLKSFRANSESVVIENNGVVLIKIISGNQIIIFKAISH